MTLLPQGAILLLFRTLVDLEAITKPLSTAIGCRFRGSALSAKKVLDVLQYASEPFPPPALPTKPSLNLATKQVLGWLLDVLQPLKALNHHFFEIIQSVCKILKFTADTLVNDACQW